MDIHCHLSLYGRSMKRPGNVDNLTMKIVVGTLNTKEKEYEVKTGCRCR